MLFTLIWIIFCTAHDFQRIGFFDKINNFPVIEFISENSVTILKFVALYIDLDRFL